MNTPWQRYQQHLQDADFQQDPAQAEAMQALEQVYQQLLNHKQRKRSFVDRLKKNPKNNAGWPQGLYMWGGVGRGKTFLMDNFYEALPIEKKVRIHFHRFMQQVHAELKNLGNIQNPLPKVADTIVGNARVICFDEFFVTDITDAMLLGGLFEALFERGITLIATSNIEPDGLYKNGLQRERFLPAIAALKQHCQVMNVDGGTDFRLRTLEQAEIYHCPISDTTDHELANEFTKLAPGSAKTDFDIQINDRPLHCQRLAEDVVWFTWAELCDGPRSQNDYIELARQFHTVILSDVPVMNWEMENQARRFINLIDEFYDRNVKLIISAAAPITEIYTGKRVEFEIERTQSRLLEMQSNDYLAQPHLP